MFENIYAIVFRNELVLVEVLLINVFFNEAEYTLRTVLKDLLLSMFMLM